MYTVLLFLVWSDRREHDQLTLQANAHAPEQLRSPYTRRAFSSMGIYRTVTLAWHKANFRI